MTGMSDEAVLGMGRVGDYAGSMSSFRTEVRTNSTAFYDLHG